MEFREHISESDIELNTTVFPSGVRDFCLCRLDDQGKYKPINPVELIVLDRANDLLEKEKATNPPKAMCMALARLLTRNIQTKGVGRHLVTEAWSEAAIRGETLPNETRTSFSVELSQVQAEKWGAVVACEAVPDGSLEQIFWEAVTDLPQLPSKFEDPDLGKFAKSLYFHFVEPGVGQKEFASWEKLSEDFEQCRKGEFGALESINFDQTKMRKLYRKFMAVTIRWMSKMTGDLARSIIDERREDDVPLQPSEVLMHDLRYGASECFGKINVGFLFGCGPLFEAFFNDIFRSVAGGGCTLESEAALDNLMRFVYLQRNYLTLRKHSRRDEKQLRRSLYRDKLPSGRVAPDSCIDDRVPQTIEVEIISEEMNLLMNEILPALEKSKPAQAKLLRSFIEHDGNIDAAALSHDMSNLKFTRRLRETVFPATQRLASKLGFGELLETSRIRQIPSSSLTASNDR